MIYKCVKKCFFQNRLWNPNESRKMVLKEGEKLPKGCFIEINRKEQDTSENEIVSKTLASIQNENEQGETEALLMKNTKDDLIALATEKGLSKGRDLVSLSKKEIISLILGLGKLDENSESAEDNQKASENVGLSEEVLS